MNLIRFTRTAWIAFFIALLASFFMTSIAHAQESPEVIAKKYGITFPIAEFNNCQDYAACHTFCDDPINLSVCKAYFKSKGIYKEDPAEGQVVSVAKGELGCDSAESCETFCQRQENFEKCNAFVGKYKEKLGIKGGYVKDPDKFVDTAKQVLGCDSPQSCRNFCDKEENRQKCDQFKNQIGCRGGIEHKGPGGCNSEETCRAFCSDPNNFAECSKFGSSPDQSGGLASHFKGPGGCDSEASCRSFCEKNPQECKIVAIGGSGLIDPAKAQEEYKRFCQANPGKCATADANPFASNVGRAEFERFCEANPEKCGGGHEEEFKQARKAEFSRICQENPKHCQTGPGGYQIPTGFHSEGGFIDPNDYCKRYPERCAGGAGYNPEAMCKQAPNCKWENNTCRCGSFSPVPNSSAPYPSYSPSPNYTPYPESSYQPYPRIYITPVPTSGGSSGNHYYTNDPTTSCKNAGGSWTGSYCQMPPTSGGYVAPSSAPQPAQTAAPTQTSAPVSQPEQTQAPTVQTQTTMSTPAPSPEIHGISTVRSIFQRILDFLR